MDAPAARGAENSCWRWQEDFRGLQSAILIGVRTLGANSGLQGTGASVTKFCGALTLAVTPSGRRVLMTLRWLAIASALG